MHVRDHLKLTLFGFTAGILLLWFGETPLLWFGETVGATDTGSRPAYPVSVDIGKEYSDTHAIAKARAELYKLAEGSREIRVVYDVKNIGPSANHRHAWRVDILDEWNEVVTSLSGVSFGDLDTGASGTFSQSFAGATIDEYDPGVHTLRISALNAAGSWSSEDLFHRDHKNPGGFSF